MLNQDTAYVHIPILSKHQSTNIVSPVLFNLYTEQHLKMVNSKMYWCFSKEG